MLLHGDGGVDRPAVVHVLVEDVVVLLALAVLPEGQAAVQHVARLHRVRVRVLVVLRAPLEVLVVDLPAVARPRVDRLDEVQVVLSRGRVRR